MSEYGSARAALLGRQQREKWSPQQTAEALGTLIERFPQHRFLLQQECAVYDAADEWGDVQFPPEILAEHGAIR